MKYLLFTFLLSIQLVQGQTTLQPQAAQPAEATRIGIDGDSSLFVYNPIGPYSLKQRADRITTNLDELITLGLDVSLIEFKTEGDFVDLVCSGIFIMSISDADADSLSLSKNAAAQFYAEEIARYVDNRSNVPINIKSLAVNIVIAVLILGVFLFGLRYFNRLFRFVYTKIERQKGKLFNGFSIKNYELLTKDKQVLFVIYAAKVLKIAVLLLSIYLLLPVIFSLFPWTQPIANKLFGYIITPVKRLGLQFLNYIPSLLTIAVIWFVTRYILKLLAFFKEEIRRGKLQINGFYPEWAKPTFNIIRFMIVALAFVAIWPLLPMSDSDIFKGVSTFVGLLVALGGAGAISNVIAGILITYMRSFEIGDRVKIGEVIGDVREKSLLNTRIKTIKNEIITIPNSQMLNSHTINYTTANDEQGLILYTTVTIGYDVPWRKVHELLVDAALKTEFIKKLPRPYVLQTSLDDFYVSYQLNARTREIDKMAVIYSEMHKNIQDAFNKAGIEIMSPHYGAHRDGNHSTIPQEHLPEEYRAPWFRIKQ